MGRASGRINTCTLLHDSRQLVKGGEMTGSHDDTCLTLIWEDSQFAKDIYMTREACSLAEEIKASINKQQQELDGATALLEQVRERQKLLLTKMDRAGVSADGLSLRIGNGL